MWKQSVVASVVREKSSELNVSPGERFYIAHLVFQSTSRADDGKCQEGTLLGLLVLLLRSPQRRSSDVVVVRSVCVGVMFMFMYHVVCVVFG